MAHVRLDWQARMTGGGSGCPEPESNNLTTTTLPFKVLEALLLAFAAHKERKKYSVESCGGALMLKMRARVCAW